MPILSLSTQRDFASWLIWLLVVISMLLMHGSTLPAVGSGGFPTDVWQSTFDPVPWFGRRLRLQWCAAWWKIRRWVNEWERWLVLAIRLWSCHNLAEVIQVLTRKQLVRHMSALPILVALLSIAARCIPVIAALMGTTKRSVEGARFLVLEGLQNLN